MQWSRGLTNLRDALADLFWDYNDAVAIVRAAGLSPAHIRFDRDKSINNWTFILEHAQQQGKVEAIVDEARKQFPNDPIIASAAEGRLLDAIRGPDLDEIPWESPDESEDSLEKILGSTSTLLPISFLETGLTKSRAVMRIACGGGLGTGFLTEDNLIVTNNHVIRSEAAAAGAEAQFNYQKSADGLDLPVTIKKLAPEEGFATSMEHDWTVVRLAEPEVAEEWGCLPLAAQYPKREDRAIIIQHPGGGPKEIGVYRNLISYANSETGRVQYWTDTLPGSSGSPVFDHHWNVIALHHSGGRIREPGTKKLVYRNEGIHISTVAAGIEEAREAGKI